MSGTSERLAAHVLFPKRGEVYSGTSTTTDKYVDLSQTVGSVTAFFRGRFVTVQALSADLYVALHSNSSDTINPALAGDAVAATNCICIPSGQERSFFVPDSGDTGARYLVFRTASGSGTMRLWASSPKMHGAGR